MDAPLRPNGGNLGGSSRPLLSVVMIESGHQCDEAASERDNDTDNTNAKDVREAVCTDGDGGCAWDLRFGVV